jgi:hypothetical protein
MRSFLRELPRHNLVVQYRHLILPRQHVRFLITEYMAQQPAAPPPAEYCVDLPYNTLLAQPVKDFPAPFPTLAKN